MSRSISSTQDRNFKYPPSKNIYWEKLRQLPPEMSQLAFGDQETEHHAGTWNSQFKNSSDSSGASGNTTRRPLHVEIGCNAGHVSLEWAKAHPEQNYIGIDWKHKQVFRMVEKIHKNSLKNLLAFRANAERLPFMFAPGEIDFLHMFFPDPWPKKSQKKNRTANTAWLKSIAPLLSRTGVFHLKTDHAEYFEFILENLKELEQEFEVLEMTRDLHAHNPQAALLKIPDVTLFERLFIKDGLPIHSVKIRSRSSSA